MSLADRDGLIWMDGEMVPWNGVFSIGLEAPIVHPHCRCAMVIVPPERFL